MKGLGRNIKYISSMLLELQVVTYLIWILVFVLLSFGEVEPLTLLTHAIPVNGLLLSFMLLLICVGFAEYYCRNMVFLGSARKPAALGIIISVQVFMVLQLVILFALSLFARNNFVTEIIWSCPLGIIALSLFIMGIGLLLVSLSLKGHYVCVAILSFIWAFVGVGLIGGISTILTLEKNEALLAPCNSLWVLLVGLAVDAIGVFVYYKTVTKADLKLV